MITKVMSPEQLFDSLMTATAGRALAAQHAKEEAMEKKKSKGKTPPPAAEKDKEEAKGGVDREQYREMKERWLASLLLNFGNDEGEEGNFSGTVVQALMLINGKDINDAIVDQNFGTVASVNRDKGLAISKGAIRHALSGRPQSPMHVGRGIRQKINNPAMVYPLTTIRARRPPLRERRTSTGPTIRTSSGPCSTAASSS